MVDERPPPWAGGALADCRRLRVLLLRLRRGARHDPGGVHRQPQRCLDGAERAQDGNVPRASQSPQAQA
eukprot:1920087-Lingulodinium_polyedra.AAC.1